MQLQLKNNFFPWLDNAWQTLQNTHRANRLAHAYLLTGVEGIGKKQFADAFAASLLCLEQDQDHFACGRCTNCQLLAAQTYPSLMTISPEEDSVIIKVDQVRRLIEFSNKMAQGFKIIIITPAESMNISAANALLKTLEEPGKDTLIFLITSQLTLLPATIRSRCQILKLASPTKKQGLAWLSTQVSSKEKDAVETALNLSQNAPLKALDLLESDGLQLRNACFKAWGLWQNGKIDLIKLVEQFQEIELKVALGHYTTWVMDLIKIKLACSSAIINIDLASSLVKLAEQMELSKLFNDFDRLKETKALLNRKINLNAQLLLEDLFLSCHWAK